MRDTSTTAGSLGAFQSAFAASLMNPALDDGRVASLARQPGFAVYRNTVAKGCVDAIVANFPAVMQAVGEEWLRAAALRYVRSSPPADPRLLVYGETFAGFLDDFEPAQDMPWLAELARVDRWWTEAHVAEDAEPLPASALAAIPAAQLENVVIRLHPSARWGWFDGTPTHTLWRLNRDGADEAAFAAVQWTGEGVLIVRPHGAVESLRLGDGACAFLDACAAGRPLSEAAAAACRAEPDTDLTQLMTTLVGAGAFCRIDSKREQ